ncbi:hypothetical protein KKA00_04210 [bacterium]|nr:hypothetical protein [bacterium]MBU1651398.1 hypothetical protein [bacterium]
MKSTSSAKIHYRRGEAENAAKILSAVDEHLTKLTEKLAVSLPYTPQLYLTTSQEEFDRITGGFLPQWSQGVSSAMSGQIVLKSPSFSKNIATVKQTAVHELTHLFIAQKAGHGVPRWLNEGLAQLLAGQGQGEPLLPISRAMWAGKLIPLSDIDFVDRMTHKDAELAYLQSFNAVEFLVQDYGWEAMRDLLSALGQNSTPDEAFSQVYLFDQAGFESIWLQHLQKSHRWMILLDTQLYIFSGATILVLLSGIAILRKRRKIYKKWESEENSYTGTI